MDKLVARLQQGDEAAFEEFVTRYERQVYVLALRQLGNAYDAQDAAQEVFLRVYRGIRQFREESKLSTWVYQITMNVCMDSLRKFSRRQETAADPDEDDPMESVPDETYAPEPLYERTELREQVEEALKKLSPEHRQIVVLRDIAGCGYDEIAEILGLADGTVKSRLFRARDKLAAILKSGGNKIGAAPSKTVTSNRAGR